MHQRVSAFIVVAAVVVTGGVVLACRDSQTATAPRDRSTIVASIAESGPASRNQLSWVGVAHNAALDAFRAELSKPHVRKLDMCKYIVAFATSDARIPNERLAAKSSLGPEARRNATRKALGETDLCARRVAQHAQGPTLASLASFSPRYLSTVSSVGTRVQSTQPSPAAYSLYAQIEAAIDAAAGSADLAARLGPVLGAAAQLNEVEHATIAATVSVAQSSFEYWESQFPPYVDQVAATYGPCIDDSYVAGYTLDGTVYRCTNGGGVSVEVPASLRTPRRVYRPTLLMAVARPERSAQQCGYYCQGFRAIGKQDAQGAFTGGFAGALVGGPQGAALGAVVAGSGASMAASLGLAISAIWNFKYR